MTRYSSTMTEALQEVREGFSSKQIKMAIGIASDKRYAGGNYTGAVNAIEKIKKGLSDHPQVAAVLKRQNEDLEEALPPHLAKLFDKDGNFKDPKKQRVFDRMMGDGIGKEIAQKMGRIKFRVKADSSKKKVMVYVDQNDESDAQKALKNHPAYVSGALRVIPEGVNEEVELQEKVDKKLALKILSMMKNQKFVKVSGDFVPEIYLSSMDRDALKKEFGRLPRGLPNASNGVPVVDFINYALGLDNEIDTEDGDKPQPKLYDYRTGKVIGKPKTVGDAAKMAGLRLEEVELEEKLGKDADAGDYIDDFKKSDAPQFKGKSDKKKRDMAIAAYLDAKDKKEEVEVDEALKYHFAVVDPEGKVAGMSTSEREAKDIASRHKGKVVKLKKPMATKKGDMMINRPLKEGTWALPDSPKSKAALKKLMSKPIKLGKEGDNAADLMYSLIGDDELFDDLYVAGKKNPNGDARDVIKKAMKRLGIKEEDEKKPDKPDSAKAVDQARDDKKKTRIAQLQLQIAKASEMINKLNSQEKPDA